MLRISIICVGKIKEKYMQEAISDYCLRLSKYVKISITEVPEDQNSDTSKRIEAECDAMIRKTPADAYKIVLDLKGKELTSEQLAAQLEKIPLQGFSHIVFYIGGSDGLSDKIRKTADGSFCMSKLTFTHQMARLILSEQIYRAMKINSGEKYHK